MPREELSRHHPYLHKPHAHFPGNPHSQTLLLAYMTLWHTLPSPTAHQFANNDLPEITE